MWLKHLWNKTGWFLSAFLYLSYAIWLFSFPASINSDDAFHFLQGVERYSILEFRPHFPGYPGYIALAKIIHLLGISPMDALFILSNLATLSIPILCCLITPNHRLAVFLFALSFPLLPLLGLSLLSDGIGIAFFLASLWQVRRGNLPLSGGLLGMVLACRPSFFIPVAAFGLYILFQRSKGWQWFILSGFLTCIIFFGAMFLLEGSPLIWEGFRFIEGHFLIWGNTALTQTNQAHSWGQSLLDIQGGHVYAITLLIVLIYTVYQTFKQNLWKDAIFITCCLTWGWTISFQNPENLRHFALPLLLSGLLIAKVDFPKARHTLMGLCLLQTALLLPYLKSPQAAPLQQVKEFLQTQTLRNVLSQHGLFYLRNELPEFHIYDAFYDQRIKGQYWRLSTNQPASQEDIIFPARILGEKKYVLTIKPPS